MHPLLIELEFERKNLRRVLNFLQREIDELVRSPQRPLDAIKLTLEYLQLQPERSHHANEDWILSELSRSGCPFGDLSTVQSDHGAFSDVLERLIRMLDSHPYSQRLHDDLRAFHHRYTRHLRLENNQLSPAAEDHLDYKAWSRIEECWTLFPDPVFGDRVKPHFLQLVTALR